MFRHTFLLFAISLTSIFNFSYSIYSQEIDTCTITGAYKQILLTDLFKEIENKYQLKFFYKTEWFENETISVTFNSTPLIRFLDRITDGKPYIYQIIQGKMIVFLPKEEVALMLKQMINNGQNQDISYTIIGNPHDAGKYKKVVIKGCVRDGKTGEALIGSNIQIENTTIGSVSNIKGNYSLIVSPGIFNFVVSNVGYERNVIKVKVFGNGNLDIELFEKSLKLEEISIYAQKPDKNVRNNQMSLVEMDSKSIKQLPSLTGEKDIIKSFIMMPGIKSIGEFGSGINVRGGGEDQNLYLIEGTPIFNTTHVFGLLSVVNPDVINNVTLYKGHIPSGFGERVSSVMDIQVRDNNGKTLQSKGGIGLYNSRLMIEGPIIKDSFTFKIGGRTSYSNWLLKQIPDYYLQNSMATFYDINGIVSWKNKNDRFTIFGYKSMDNFRYARLLAYNYGNILGSINWNHYFNQNINSVLILSYSRYEASKDNIEQGYEKNRFATSLNYLSCKYNIKYTGFTRHTLDAGVQSILYNISPGKRTPLDSSSLLQTSFKLEDENGIENAIYLNNLFEINEKLSLNVGIRFSVYYLLGPKNIIHYTSNFDTKLDSTYYKAGKIVSTYYGLEPRLSFKFQINKESSVKLSYNKNYQYISLLSYSSVIVPTDRWKLSDPYIKPIYVNNYAFGFYRNFLDNSIETSIECYYKTLNNITEYKNDAKIEMNPYVEGELIEASGKNYGIEMMIKKNKGRWDGWISYTYSRSLKKTHGRFKEEIINRNSFYPSSYDKPHDLTVLLTYHPNRRWRLSGNFTITSGRPIALPEYKYVHISEVQMESSKYRAVSGEIVLFSDRGKYRLPPYHRLDLSISLDESLKIKKRWKGSWTFSLLNVYARKNAYSVFYKKEVPTYENDYKMYSLYKLYLIGRPLPTLTYNFIF
jgi:hypothetical protein